MTIYSQRDIKWSKELMGDGTIGNFGCLITCIGMLLDKDPSAVNSAIKIAQGYSGNFVIWEALDKISGLDFIKRVRVYENDEVSKNIPCLVEVNGAPIGGTTHWVLYIGNQKCWDPWDGTEKPTSSYKPIGYAVVKRLEVSVPAPTPSTIDLGGLQTPLETYGVMEISTLKSKLLAKDTDLKNQDNLIDALDKNLEELQASYQASLIKLENIKTVVNDKWTWVGIRGWKNQLAKLRELLV